jgi:enolase
LRSSEGQKKEKSGPIHEIWANLTETIEIISVNEPFAQQDFAYPVPTGLQLRQVN